MSPQRDTEDSVHRALSEPLLSPLQQHLKQRGGNDEIRNGNAQTCIIMENNAQNSNKQKSPNVNYILAYTLLAFAGRAIWYQSVLSNFCYLLRNNNPEAVGFITSVMGLSQLLASFPTGVLSDYYSASNQHGSGKRDVLLKIASVIGIFASCLTCVSVYKESYILLTVALAVWGCVWGIANTSLTAIFADSIHDGDRSKYFTQRSILIKLANTTGPLVALVLFYFLGDQWTLHDCAVVMLVGQVISLPSIILLCFPSDKHIIVKDESQMEEEAASYTLTRTNLMLLPESSTAASPTTLLFPSSSSNSIDSDESDNADYWMSPLQSELDEEHDPLLSLEQSIEDTSIEFLETTNTTNNSCCCVLPPHRIIPIMVALADIISGLASGMSIRYFPIFFYENLHLGPVMVQVLGVLAPLTGTLLAHVGQLCSLSIGRCRMTCLYKWIGIGCMLAMIASYKLEWPIWCTCVLYLVRTSFMNSTNALTKSVLMDAVPSHERGKWSALESVNMFSWSGSAAVGGVLVGLEGIVFNFCITATLQFVATMPLVFLFTRFEKREQLQQQSPNEDDATSQSPTNSSQDAKLQTPHFTNDDRFKV